MKSFLFLFYFTIGIFNNAFAAEPSVLISETLGSAVYQGKINSAKYGTFVVTTTIRMTPSQSAPLRSEHVVRKPTDSESSELLCYSRLSTNLGSIKTVVSDQNRILSDATLPLEIELIYEREINNPNECVPLTLNQNQKYMFTVKPNFINPDRVLTYARPLFKYKNVSLAFFSTYFKVGVLYVEESLQVFSLDELIKDIHYLPYQLVEEDGPNIFTGEQSSVEMQRVY